MANEENLKPFNTLTVSEQREIQKKGGIASAESRREKKMITKAIESMMKANAPDNLVEKMKRNGVGGTDYCAALVYALFSRGLKGDVTAIKLIIEMMGESPAANINVNADVNNNPFSGLSTEELRKILEDG